MNKYFETKHSLVVPIYHLHKVRSTRDKIISSLGLQQQWIRYPRTSLVSCSPIKQHLHDRTGVQYSIRPSIHPSPAALHTHRVALLMKRCHHRRLHMSPPVPGSRTWGHNVALPRRGDDDTMAFPSPPHPIHCPPLRRAQLPRTRTVRWWHAPTVHPPAHRWSARCDASRAPSGDRSRGMMGDGSTIFLRLLEQFFFFFFSLLICFCFRCSGLLFSGPNVSGMWMWS